MQNEPNTVVIEERDLVYMYVFMYDSWYEITVIFIREGKIMGVILITSGVLQHGIR